MTARRGEVSFVLMGLASPADTLKTPLGHGSLEAGLAALLG